MLCSPTNVAAANCQALLPVSSHLGEGTSIDLPLDVFCCDEAHNPRFPRMGPYERTGLVEARAMPAAFAQSNRPQNPRPPQKIVGHAAGIAHKLGKRGRRIFIRIGLRRPALHRAAIWVWIGAWRSTRSCSATGSSRQE